MAPMRDSHWPGILGLGAAFALLFSALGGGPDVLQEAPAAYQRFGFFITSLAAGAAYLAIVFGIALGVGFAVGAVVRDAAAPVTIAVAAFFGVYTIFMPAFGAHEVPLPTRGGVSTWALAALSLLLGLAVLAVLLERRRHPQWERALALTSVAAFLALAGAVGLWQLRFWGPATVWFGILVLAAMAVASLRLSAKGRSAVSIGALTVLLVGGWMNWKLEAGFSPTNQLGGAPGPIPRVILITIDTLRADSLSGPAGERPATPFMDAFAQESYVFERAISSGPWTPPGMSSLLTGLDPFSHGVGLGRIELPVELPTLPERMASAGYQIGGTGLNPIIRRAGLIDRWPWIHWHPYRPMPPSIGNFFLRTGVAFYHWNPTTTELTDWAMDWLRDNSSREFYFWLHYYDPHVPYSPPDGLLDYSQATERIGRELSIDGVESIRSGAPVLEERDRKWLRALYDAEVTNVDQNLGRLFETLRELGIYEQSLIIVSSDHGEEFFDHGGFEHGQNLYNELLHVPLVVRPPGGARGTVVSDFVATASVTPTVLDLAGVEYDPAEMTYPPLSPYMGGAGAEETPIFSAGVRFFENWISVVFDNHKYIRRMVTGREELYNLLDDPAEKVNLADPELLARGRKLIEERLVQGEAIRRRYGVVNAEEVGLNESTRKQLESLGYIQ